MFFLLGGNEKKNRKAEVQKTDRVTDRVKELFLGGKFPVVTTDKVEGRQIAKVLGLVCCRGYDSEEAFFGMASRAVTKGAHAIVGYCENVAFHPDGSKYFSCFGTAIMFEWESEEKFGAAALLNRPLRLSEEEQPALKMNPSRENTSMRGRTVDQVLNDSDLTMPPLDDRVAGERASGERSARQWRSQ